MERTEDEWVQRRVFLFSHPRTASNLLTRMLSGQSEWHITDYHFFGAFHFGRENFNDVSGIAELEADKRDQYDALVDEGRRRLKSSMEDAAGERKHCFIKNHAFMVIPPELTFWEVERKKLSENPREPCAGVDSEKNPTIFSDGEMLSWQPIILIRNPIAVFESWMRVMGTPFPDLDSRVSLLYTTFRHQRRIFDWYHKSSSNSSTGKPPIVVDADDLIEGTEVPHQLCSLLGMSSEELLFQWDVEPPSTEPKGQKMRLQHFRDTIRNSTGVDRSKTSRDLDLESKKTEWAKMFGDERASVLAERVRMSWPDYEYLKAFRLGGSGLGIEK